MPRFIKIAAAIWTLVAGLIWLLSGISAGFTIPTWVPASGLFAVGVYVVMDVFGI